MGMRVFVVHVCDAGCEFVCMKGAVLFWSAMGYFREKNRHYHSLVCKLASKQEVGWDVAFCNRWCDKNNGLSHMQAIVCKLERKMHVMCSV